MKKNTCDLDAKSVYCIPTYNFKLNSQEKNSILKKQLKPTYFCLKNFV